MVKRLNDKQGWETRDEEHGVEHYEPPPVGDAEPRILVALP